MRHHQMVLRQSTVPSIELKYIKKVSLYTVKYARKLNHLT